MNSRSPIWSRSKESRGHVRHARAVGQHVADGDRVLAVDAVAGDVVGHRLVQADQPPLDQPVHHERGHRLRRRVHAERRVGGHRHLDRVGRVAWAVAVRVADGPVQHHLAVAAHAYLHRRVHAGAVPGDRVAPDLLHRLARHARVGRVGLRADGGDRFQIARHPDAAQRIGDQRQAGDPWHPPMLSRRRARRWVPRWPPAARVAAPAELHPLAHRGQRRRAALADVQPRGLQPRAGARASSSFTVTVPAMPARRSGHAAADTSAQSRPAIVVPGVGTATGSPAASDAVRHAAVTGSTPTTGIPAWAPKRAAAAASDPTPTGTTSTSNRPGRRPRRTAWRSRRSRRGPAPSRPRRRSPAMPARWPSRASQRHALLVCARPPRTSAPSSAIAARRAASGDRAGTRGRPIRGGQPRAPRRGRGCRRWRPPASWWRARRPARARPPTTPQDLERGQAQAVGLVLDQDSTAGQLAHRRGRVARQRMVEAGGRGGGRPHGGAVVVGVYAHQRGSRALTCTSSAV